MKISAINNTPNFEGRIITKGAWTNTLREQFEHNPEIIKLAAGEKDIIGNMSSRIARSSVHHSGGEELFKLTLKAAPSKMTLKEKIKDFFGFLPIINITANYHRENSMLRIMQERINASKYSKRLGLTDIKNI